MNKIILNIDKRIRRLMLSSLVMSLLIMTGSIVAYSQTTPLVNIQNGAKVNFANGSTVIINGSLHNATGATLNLNGIIGIYENWQNDGSQTASNTSRVEFIGSANAEISGTGSTQFYRILVNKDTREVILRLNTALAASTPSGFMELRNGSFRVVGNDVFSNKFFVPINGEISIPGTAEFWLENPNVVVEAQLVDIILGGQLKISNGVFNAGYSIAYTSTPGTPAELELENGTLNVGRGIASRDITPNNHVINFTQKGGTVNLATAGIEAGRTKPVFEITNANSIVNISGGEIVLKNENSDNSVNDYYVQANNNTITGGTLKIDAQGANQQFNILSRIPIGNFLMSGANSPQVMLNSQMKVIHDVTIAGDGEKRFHMNGNDVELGGDWHHNVTQADGLFQSTHKIIFVGDSTQNITATTIEPVFTKLVNNKTAKFLVMQKPMSVNEGLYLVGSYAIIDMQSNNLTIGPATRIFSDINGNYSNISSFGANKYVMNSGSGTDPLAGARLIRRLPSNIVLPAVIAFPIGTPNGFSPVDVEIPVGGANFAADPNISIKVVPLEHPGVEVTNKALKKYWNIRTQDITLINNKTNLRFFYLASDVGGSEGYYRAAKYDPEWNNAAGLWKAEPGITQNIVDFSTRVITSQGLNDIDADWSAAQQEAMSGFYYSRADGDYNDRSTWSREGFGGAPSATIPNKASDQVRIQGNVVEITSNIAPANLLSVETGQDGRTDGVLKIRGNFAVKGDTFKLEANTKLYIGSDKGISAAPTMEGNIQTASRKLSSDAKYYYWGNNDQITGAGLPNEIAYLNIEKSLPTAKVTQSKNLLIKNAFHLEKGIYDMSLYTLDGISSNRSFTMNGGEFIVNSAFPSNYTPPTFTVGQITFAGISNITIPSTGSVPAIAQYYDVKISSTGRTGNITLEREGEIKIGHNLDISQMKFANNSFKFFTDGSTVRYNSSTIDQSIQFTPASPSDTICYLNYYNLILDGAGIARITSSNANARFTILKNITLENNCNFDANNFQIDLHGDWKNLGGKFTQGNKTLNFISDVATIANHVISRNTTDNPFNNVRMVGPGITQIEDNMLITGNLLIDTAAVFNARSYQVNLKGDWTNKGGTFTPETSTVLLDGANQQNIIKTSGNETFNNLTINNAKNVNAFQVGSDTSGVIINGELALNAGNIIVHNANTYRYVQLNGTLTRTGLGFVDGELRKKIGTGASIVEYEVGYNKAYTPVTLEFTGTGGSQGFLGVISDTINSTTNPIKWVGNPATALSPGNSMIDHSKHIARRYGVSIPNSSTFALTNTRQYNAKVQFVPGDVKGGANPQQFTMSVLKNPTTPEWVYPFSYENLVKPIVSEKTAITTKMNMLKDFGNILVGNPAILVYYSRKDGNWNDATSWSLEGYGDVAAPTFPGQDNNNVYIAYIGNKNTITMTTDVTVTKSAVSLPTNAAVIVDSAKGAGKLVMGEKILSGTGDFRMLAYSTLSIGSPQGITRTNKPDANSGNIRTAVREYNYQKHHRGIFIYTGAYNGTTGSGLPNANGNGAVPDTILQLIVDKAPGNTLNQWGEAGSGWSNSSMLHILDTLWIKKGTLALSTASWADLLLYGDMIVDNGAGFVHNTRTVWFRGDKPQYVQAGAYNQPITFARFDIDKKQNAGDIILKPNTNIIVNDLYFETANKVILDATTHSTLNNPLYVQLNSSGGVVTNARQITETQGGGWVWGEIRRWVPAGTEYAVKFETGTSQYYAPFELKFNKNGGTAGWLSGRTVEGEHPMLDYGSIENYPINKSRQFNLYWKLKKPNGSTFALNYRGYDVTVWYHSAANTTNVDCAGCADLAFYRGGAINNTYYNNQWQGLFAKNGRANKYSDNTSVGEACSDTRVSPNGIPAVFKYSYIGEDCGEPTLPTSMLGVKSILGWTDAKFGTGTIGTSGDVLLADYVAGNRNTIKFYSFYSIKDGDWSDPTTWSTDGYNSTNNAALADSASKDIRPVPMRQYDNVYIGNGKKVKLDVMFGTNFPDLAQGPSLTVENTGTLDFGSTPYRGASFSAKSGSTLIIGATDGIEALAALSKGNIQLYTNKANISDSINIVYSPKGKTPNFKTISGLAIDASNHYITSVEFKQGTTSLLKYESREKFRPLNTKVFFAPAKINVVAGGTYSATINTNSAQAKYFIVQILNYDGTWTTLNSKTKDPGNFETVDFTIPTQVDKGTTLLRVIAPTDLNLNTDATKGEAEMYTIHIDKPNYVVNQVPGNGLPSVLKSLTLTTNNAPEASQTLTLNKDLTIVDSFKVEKATFINGANNIQIAGDLIINNDHSFNPGTGLITFIENKQTTVRGNARFPFNNIRLLKKDGFVYANTDILINGSLTIDSSNSCVLADNKTITFAPAATITGKQPSNKVMIKVSGSDNSGIVTKEYQPGTATNKVFTFPVGVDTIYNPAKIDLTANYANPSSVSIQLIGSRHANRLNNDILKKYWKLSTTGISNITASKLEFSYVNADTAGDINKYIPARYNNGWEIDLGTNPVGKPNKITVTDEFNLTGDWTTGIPTAWFDGRIFYSRATGDWNNKANWSTNQVLKHTGKAAAYYPGELYNSDTVNIDGHYINFNVQRVEIDSLRMGGTNGTSGDVSRLLFATNQPSTLALRQVFLDTDSAEIASLDNNSGIDTLLIRKSFVNKSTGVGLVGYKSPNSSVVLKFNGSGNSYISGEGKYQSLYDVIVQKEGGLSDTLINESSTFANMTLQTGPVANFGNITPLSGVVRNDADVAIGLSSVAKPNINMGMYSGIDCRKNATWTRGTLTTNTNTTINVDGGNFFVGMVSDIHLLYKTGTKINVKNGIFQVGGAFARFNENATADFTMTGGYVYVNRYGNTASDKIGFDLSNSASSITMTAGQIIVMNGGGTTPNAFDLRINAMNGGGITGGTIRTGHTQITPDNTVFKIGGLTPIYDLHFSNGIDPGISSTNIVEQNYTIKNNWQIDGRHNFNLSGNTVKLGGNLDNSGVFTAAPSAPTLEHWLLELNGAADQTITDNSANAANGLDLFNFRVNKPTGDVLLGGTKTTLSISGSLEYATNNNAIINTQADDMAKSVIVTRKPQIGNTPQVVRAGKGHVNGFFGRWITSAATSVKFDIGGVDNTLYRPIEVQTIGNNTAGILMTKFKNTDHPDINNAGVDLTTNLQKFWVVTPHPTIPFSLTLTTGQSYNLTINYDKLVDFRASTNELELDQMMRTPSYLSGAGTWNVLNTLERQTNISRSFGNTQFGDVILAVQSGTTFYSIGSGNWDTPANWSNTSYTGAAATRFPNINTDIVKIGNGKKITIPETLLNPTVRSVVVEKYNGLPGELQINGKLNAINGRSFVLKDSCTLGMQHQNGINTVIEGARGAVITQSRTFGMGRFIFNSSYGSQISGNALPNTIKTLIIDNPSASSKALFLHNSPGLTDLKIKDTLAIVQGIFNTSDRNIDISKAMIVDSLVNDGELAGGTSKFTFTGGGNKYIDLGNYSGLRFNRLELENSNIIAEHKTRRNTIYEHIYVKSNLNFNGANSMFILGDSVNITIENTLTYTSITGFGPTNFILTSNNSGMLIRKVSKGSKYDFPIGSKENNNLMYAPAELALDRDGSTGSIGIRTSWGSNPKGGHKYLAGTPEAGYLKRYWAVDSVTMQINGVLSFTYNDADFLNGFDENSITRIARWRPARERAGGPWTHPVDITQLVKNMNLFSTTNGNYAELAGDWTLGNEKAFRRIFYSLSNGNWNDPNSWTFNDTHSGTFVGAGLFPNAEGDSVVIGGSKTITLNVSNPFANNNGVGIQLGNTPTNKGILKILDNNVLNGDYFKLIDGSELYIGSALGITSIPTSAGNIQTVKSREYSANATYVYSGSTNQQIGNGLPNLVAALGVDNSGTTTNNRVTFDRNISVSKVFFVNNGEADISDKVISASGSDALFTILNNSFLRIAGANNPAMSIPVYKSYILSETSTVEFYGDMQDFSIVPLKLYDPANPDEIMQGYGNVLHSNGSSTLTNKILIRGNLTNNSTANITVQEGTNSVKVIKNIVNEGSLTNKGKIEIGKCE